MRKSALAAGALLATGLVAGLGGTAFADAGGGSATTPTDGGEDTSRGTTQQEQQQPATTTQAAADAHRAVIGLNVPVALDLHEGVANDLNVQDVAQDVVHVGQTQVPAVVKDVVNVGGDTSGGNVDANQNSSGEDEAQSEGRANASATTDGTDAVARAAAINVGGTVNQVVATATATVNGVTDLGINIR